MSAIHGRTDDMLIIRGVNVFPTQVEDVLGRVPELSPHYQLVVSRTGTMDELEVRTEATGDFFRVVGRRARDATRRARRITQSPSCAGACPA